MHVSPAISLKFLKISAVQSICEYKILHIHVSIRNGNCQGMGFIDP
jgi:hypothetical protein